MPRTNNKTKSKNKGRLNNKLKHIYRKTWNNDKRIFEKLRNKMEFFDEKMYLGGYSLIHISSPNDRRSLEGWRRLIVENMDRGFSDQLTIDLVEDLVPVKNGILLSEKELLELKEAGESEFKYNEYLISLYEYLYLIKEVINS